MSHTLSSLLALSMFLLASVLAQTPSPPSLPLPARDIPADLNPPLASGRNDYHGWLLLPWDQVYNPSAPVLGWLYHHTPEFWTDSPHDFEIMLAGSLKLKTPVPNLPLPPASPVLGTEYVFTPPSFSLDEMLTSKLVKFPGSLSNGSFDTPQRYKLSDGTMTVLNLTTVHYLYQNATAGYPELAYFSYPRNPSASAPTHGTQHFYFLHLEQQSPDFDQILHVTINLDECVLDSADSVQDLLQAGATFVLPGSTNKVTHRVVPASSAPTPLTVLLMTDATRYSEQHTKCAVQILEEIHCVVVPDSFANCPPVTNL